MNLLPVFLFMALAMSVRGQRLFFGSCPTPDIQQEFSVDDYLGTWYEYSNYFAVFQIGQRCVKAVYGDGGNNTITVQNSGVKASGAPASISGTAVPVGDSGAASLRVSFDGVPSFSSAANYNVLFTDYTGVSLVWSCTNMGFVNAQLLWILTRERTPSEELIADAEQRLTDLQLDVSKLHKTDQDNCSN